MSTALPPRNRYVLRRESGHPGYSNVVVLATPEDLATLADDVRQLAESRRGRIDHYVTEEKTPDSRGAIAFEVIAEEELRVLQLGDRKHRLMKIGAPLGCGIFALLAVYGGYALLKSFLP